MDGSDAAAAKGAQIALDAARDEIGEIVGRIQREAKAAATVMYGAVDDLPAIQGRLLQDEALLLYGVFTGADSVALVVTAKEARIISLGKTDGVEKAVSALRPEEETTDPAEAIRTLRALVVAPLALGEGILRVLVSPDGALSCVPFSLLMPGKEVLHVPSGTVYGLLLEEKGKKGEGVLALGDPTYREKKEPTLVASLRSGWDLAPLPQSGEEAKAVGTTVLLGKGATEEGLKAAIASRPRWHSIHLACHGLIDTERPLLSALAVTPSEAEDGFLSVLDVFRMKVPADLVVLSACETGKGKVIRGEGIIGLTRGFMFAGAPRVLVSLWKVDDAATKALMVKFYESWNAGKGAAAALKEAQAFIAAQPKWKHPKYWAAWVLWGLPE